MQLHPHAPVLARPGGVIQVGLSAPLVLGGLGRDEREFVASLEGGRAVAPLQARRFPRVITRLTNAGGWWQPERARVASVAVHGAGRLGMAVAGALAEAGLAVALHDSAPAAAEEPGLYGTVVRRTCAGAAAAVLAGRGVRVRVGGGGESLAVVVCLGVPDPSLISQYMLAGVPHVIVACSESDVFVSHVMVPGQSACVRCRDIALTRVDEAWPLLALQLGGCALTSRRPVAAAAARPVIAGAVTSRVCRWLARGDWGEAVTVGADGGTDAAPVRAEPACGCGAAGPVGDEVTARRALLREP